MILASTQETLVGRHKGTHDYVVLETLSCDTQFVENGALLRMRINKEKCMCLNFLLN
jgi:hypothetical protein